jgi:hypothetical protein
MYSVPNIDLELGGHEPISKYIRIFQNNFTNLGFFVVIKILSGPSGAMQHAAVGRCRHAEKKMENKAV